MRVEEPFQAVLARLSGELGIEAAAEPLLAQWLDLLVAWNARIDLTAARTQAELCDLMLADAAMLARELPRNVRVVDVGTGAGAPGLALALMRPDLDVTLVEPLSKRAAFLRTVVGTVRRIDVKILRERGEAVAAKSPRSFDVAISRATLAPAEWIPLALKLAPVGWALVAREEPPEVEGARVEREVMYRWVGTGVERRAVCYVGA